MANELRPPHRPALGRQQRPGFVGERPSRPPRRESRLERPEGSHPFRPDRKRGAAPFTRPAAEHHHAEARSLTGGVVYHGKHFPTWPALHLRRLLHRPHLGFGSRRLAGHPDRRDKPGGHRRAAGFIPAVPRELADTPSKSPPSPRPRRRAGHRGPRRRPLPARRRADRRTAPKFPTSSAKPASSLGRRASAAPRADSLFGQRPAVVRRRRQGTFHRPARHVANRLHRQRRLEFSGRCGLVKTFSLTTAIEQPGANRRIETRLLVKQQGEWQGFSYQWNDDQTDATLVTSRRRTLPLAAAHRRSHTRKPGDFPSRAECMVCHTRAANFVLGLSTLQMNKDHDYGASTPTNCSPSNASASFASRSGTTSAVG